MDFEEKNLKVQTLELALEDIERIIKSMKDNNYPVIEIHERERQRWSILNELHQVKKK